MSKSKHELESAEAQILDDNRTNWFVKFPDGSTDIVTKSKINTLLFREDLWGLLRAEDTVWQHSGESDVQITPMGDNNYEIQVDDKDPVLVGTHHKSELVDALCQYYDTAEANITPLVRFYNVTREKQVRKSVVNQFRVLPPIDGNVSETADGWLIHDHLLLTWDGEFHHPRTTSRTRSGGVVDEAAETKAYSMGIGQVHDAIQREIEVDGETVRLSTAEIEFISKTLWAVTNAPEDI
jgi:hypothetical protein